MNKQWFLWILSLLFATTATVVNQKYYRVENIIKIELAPCPDSLNTYIQAIAPDSSREVCFHVLMNNTIVDYYFVLGYTLLTLFSFGILLDVFDLTIPGWVYVVSVMTGLFDCCENNYLMNMSIRQREDFSWLYYDIVRIKWAFSIIPFIVIPITLFYGLTLLLRNRNNQGLGEKPKHHQVLLH